ncbi:hypothetical protein A0H81_10166 [Grifola frondosa]|uniref:Uncharacterized protein n=1 Tax=Grifola frondosa TaxID=5627 RepID=A0A1C7LY13_GRIFR|nr:hypothetical protein A0H81_10166 [Grifola frondosa]
MVTSTVTKAWQFTGGAITDTAEEIEAKLALMPEYERDCHLFYRLVISRWHPGPGLAAWRNFGFCVCFDEEEEMELGRQYQMLVRRKCTFKEFYAAYESSTLLALFESKGLRTDFRHLDDVLRGSPLRFKSVWSLKSFVLQEELEATPTLPVAVDYGFVNCKKPADFAALKSLYKKVFQSRQADPIELHEAAIGGRLLEYIETLMKLKQSDSKKFQGLLRNHYPLRTESEFEQPVC